jgi:hypothetical protein
VVERDGGHVGSPEVGWIDRATSLHLWIASGCGYGRWPFRGWDEPTSL